MGRQPIQDASQNPIRFNQGFTICKPQNFDAQLIQFGCATRVVLHFRRIEVLTAVEFDNETSLDASKVGEVPADRMLTAELAVIELPTAKTLPDDAFSIGRGLA